MSIFPFMNLIGPFKFSSLANRKESKAISRMARLLHVFEIAAGDGTTNIAFNEGEKELYVTVVKDPKDSQAKGSIVKIQM